MPSTALFSVRWVLGPRLRLIWPARSTLEALDELWAEQRPSDAANAHWLWSDIATAASERFALVDDASRTVVSIWSSGNPLVELGGVRYYRLDYMEISPVHRGVRFGAFTVDVACARARERGAVALLIPALPELTGFYGKMGAVVKAVPGWTIEKGLAPVVLEGEAFENHVRNVYELAEKP